MKILTPKEAKEIIKQKRKTLSIEKDNFWEVFRKCGNKNKR